MAYSLSALRSTAAFVALLGGVVHQANAYTVFEFFNDPSQALKWGGSNTVGTPGGVVTWSLMPNGTAIDPTDLPSNIVATSVSDLTSVFNQFGGESVAFPLIAQAFTAWSSVANITFIKVSDDGTPFNAAYNGAQAIGNIRIGAFAFQAGDFTGAVGYAAPPNGGRTLEGDIIFNVNNRFGIAPGNEGALYELYPQSNGFYYLNDFSGLLTHEIGHTIGLDHSTVPTAMMCGFVNGGFDGSSCAYNDPDGDFKAPINRIPDADDIAGVQYLYGTAPVPEPSTWAFFLAGLGLFCLVRRRNAA